MFMFTSILMSNFFFVVITNTQNNFKFVFITVCYYKKHKVVYVIKQNYAVMIQYIQKENLD